MSQIFLSPTYRGHQVAGSYIADSTDARLDLLLDGNVVRTMLVPAYRVWNWYAHANEFIDAELDYETDTAEVQA